MVGNKDTNWIERSFDVFPGGSLGEFNLPREISTVLSHGKGSRTYDVFGREYIDYSLAWGSVILGHAHPKIAEAVKKQVQKAFNFSYVTEQALELAEEIVRTIPCAEKVRFAASGTEATMYAIKLAKAYTGRDKILKFEGSYHGAHDYGVMSLFPQTLVDFPLAQPTSAGTSQALSQEVLIAPFNDLETTARIIDRHRDQLGGVIVEPLQRCTPPKEGFLEGLREVTRQREIPLIFDEVVTGFRLAYGGAQEYYGVTPDLAALGKAMGGGFPIGAFCGKTEIMDLCIEANLGSENYVWVASTGGGNPVSMAASLATLQELRKPGTYERLHGLGNALREGLREILGNLGITAQVIGDGPIGQVIFTGEKVIDYRSVFRSDRAKGRRFMLGLFEKGVFLNPLGTKLYLSLAHSDNDIDAFLERGREVLETMKA
ncbi:MAG: aminotransferase class III-fold pyridoxal phosphate-dependent enzyme [Syntrophobacterales bacterium]|nr:MAG: aminotransferase class III-fold pyridoxal phosphate-dependent enzyme [Syntrophobacterales bacterium]